MSITDDYIEKMMDAAKVEFATYKLAFAKQIRLIKLAFQKLEKRTGGQFKVNSFVESVESDHVVFDTTFGRYVLTPQEGMLIGGAEKSVQFFSNKDHRASLFSATTRRAGRTAVDLGMLPENEANFADGPMAKIEAFLVTASQQEKTVSEDSYREAINSIHAALQAMQFLEDADFKAGMPRLDAQGNTVIDTSAGKLVMNDSWVHLNKEDGTHLDVYNSITSNGSMESNVIVGVHAEALRLKRVPPVKPGDLMRAMQRIPTLA